MAAKPAKQHPASSSEDEFSSDDDDQLMNQKDESESEYEETEGESADEETEETKLRPNNPTDAQEKDDGLPEEDGSESGDSHPNTNSVSQSPTENIQKEDDDSSEESDSEEEESEQEEVFHDQKPVNKGNKKPQTETVPPAPASIKITSDDGNLKNKNIPRVWTMGDEKTLLNSMLQFRLETGKEVDSSSLEYFCDYLRGKLSFIKRPRRRQVSQKIKALRKKYSRNRFTKKQDLEMKEIATQLWGLDANGESSKRKLSLLGEEIGKLGNFRLEEKLKSGYNVEKTEALDQKIKRQKILEMKEELRTIDMKREAFKLILDVLEKKL